MARSCQGVSVEGRHGRGDLHDGRAGQLDAGRDAGEFGDRVELPGDRHLHVAIRRGLRGEVEWPSVSGAVADRVGRLRSQAGRVTQDGVVEVLVAVDVVVEVVVVGIVTGVVGAV